MGRITENDANVLSGFDDDFRADVLYRYLVMGQSMADIAYDLLDDQDGWESQSISVITRGYGFHNGAGRGRYGDIPKDLIWDFVSDHVPEDCYGGLDTGTFDKYIAGYRAQMAQQQRQQQEAAERQRQWQAQQQRLREEAERQRRIEQQRQQEAERQRRAAEQQRRQQEAAQQQARETAYSRLIASARDKLRVGRLQEALDDFYAARKNSNTYATNLGIAETLARSSNAGEHAQTIIQELEEYREKFAADMTPQQHLWLARAYVAAGRKNDACTAFFAAGDIYYDKNDFKNADACYTEGREKTNYYENKHAFHVAYARSKATDRLDDATHRFCISFYEKDIADGSACEATYINLGYHHNALKEYSETKRLLTPKAEHSSSEKLLNHLANACHNLRDFENSLRWYRKMEENGLSANQFRIGIALAALGRYDEALQEFESYEMEKAADNADIDWSANAYRDMVDVLRAYRKEDKYLLATWRATAVFLNPSLAEDSMVEMTAWYHEAQEAGNADAAKRILDSVPGLDKNLADDLLRQAKTALQEKDFTRAEKVTHEAEALYLSADAARLLANISYAQEDWAEAYERLSDLGNRWNEWDYFQLGVSALMQGDMDDAEQMLLKNLTKNPQSTGTLKNLCYIAARQGQSEKMSAYRLQLMQLGMLEDGKEWLLFAEQNGHPEAAEMLELLPEEKARREKERAEQEAREREEREEEERKRREEEEMLLLLLL